MPNETEPFGLVFWRALEREIAERAARNQSPPTKDERMALCTQLHERDIELRMASALRERAPAAGLFDGFAQPAKPKKGRVKPADDDAWLRELEADPVYTGLNIRQQFGLCNRWYTERKRIVSRRAFINWLAKAVTDKPIAVRASQFQQAPAMPEPTGWREWINANRPESLYATGQPEAWKPWNRIDKTAQGYIVEQMRRDGLV